MDFFFNFRMFLCEKYYSVISIIYLVFTLLCFFFFFFFSVDV